MAHLDHVVSLHQEGGRRKRIQAGVLPSCRGNSRRHSQALATTSASFTAHGVRSFPSTSTGARIEPRSISQQAQHRAWMVALHLVDAIEIHQEARWLRRGWRGQIETGRRSGRPMSQPSRSVWRIAIDVAVGISSSAGLQPR